MIGGFGLSQFLFRVVIVIRCWFRLFRGYRCCPARRRRVFSLPRRIPVIADVAIAAAAIAAAAIVIAIVVTIVLFCFPFCRSPQQRYRCWLLFWFALLLLLLLSLLLLSLLLLLLLCLDFLQFLSDFRVVGIVVRVTRPLSIFVVIVIVGTVIVGIVVVVIGIITVIMVCINGNYGSPFFAAQHRFRVFPWS